MNRTTVYLGFGSNLGKRDKYLHNALEKLDSLPHISIIAVSKTRKTRPLGGKKQPDYFNFAAKIETALSCDQLWQALVQIEDSLGRKRGKKWASRTIDLDILLYGDQIVNSPTLTIPHKEMHLRSFVLQGLCEISDNLIHPVLGHSMSHLAERLNGSDFVLDSKRPQLISIAGVIGTGKTTLAKQLSKALGCEIITEAYDTNPFLADVYAGKNEVALDCQLYFLNSRVAQLDGKVLPAGQLFVSDYVFDKEMIYARKMLAPEQLQSYKKENARREKSVLEPVLVIYLTNSPQVLLERIHVRNRPYEQEIDAETLQHFMAEYDSMFKSWTKSPVIKLDGAEFDSTDDDDLKSLINEVDCYICKSSKQ